MRRKDKVAIITGGARGLGKATAETFAREGASVVVADVTEEAGKETVASIEQAGGEAIYAHIDVTKSEDVQRMIQKTQEKYWNAF